jgi:5,10-methylenetetrahydrofolate reductase
VNGGRGGKLRIIEVFPPSFSVDPGREPPGGLGPKVGDFLARVRKVEGLADAFLVADIADPSRVRLSTVHTARLLHDELGVRSIPVITARDGNRQAVRTSILTSFASDLDEVMLVWGDRYAGKGDPANVYDFTGLANLIRDAGEMASRMGVKASFLAPVNLSTLGSAEGARLASGRVKAGAELLLAQPPTTDSRHAIGTHLRIINESGVGKLVLPNIFPFRDLDDISSCQARFGWKLPRRLKKLAAGGEASLLKEARRVAEYLMDERVAGMYVSTRGRPELARFILD